jgi:hypothetical protein
MTLRARRFISPPSPAGIHPALELHDVARLPAQAALGDFDAMTMFSPLLCPQ